VTSVVASLAPRRPERGRIAEGDLRGEFYNILNHANFNIPGSTFGAADFGLVTGARPGRTVQLAGRLNF
jgi:hypothetical protein